MSDAAIKLSRPKVLNHLIKGLLLAALGLGAASLVARVSNDGRAANAERYFLPQIAGALVGWLALAGCARNVHALLLEPRLVLDRDGIELRYWAVTPVPGLAMARPWCRVVAASVPWSGYRGTRVYERSGGNSPNWSSLVIDTDAGTHEIGQDVFADPPATLMAGIAHYRETELFAPVRDALRIDEFQRDRFEYPVRLECVQVGDVWELTALLWMVWIGVAGFLGLNLYMGLGTLGVRTEVLAAVGGAVLLAFLLWLVFRDRRPAYRTEVMECRAEGLALGRDEASLCLVPWKNVMYTRLMGLHAPDDGTPLGRQWVELHLRGARPVRVDPMHRREPREICDLITPPFEKVAEARRRAHDLGEDVPTACAAVGLPG